MLKKTLKLNLAVTFLLAFVMVGCKNGTGNESPKVAEQTATSEKKESASNTGYQVTFVELGSVNCVPCKMMQPIMKQVEEEYKGKVKVVFHDVWTQQGKVDGAKFNIRVIPTQVFLDSTGKEYYRHEGFFPKEELVKILDMKLK